jgi:enamine deaminase RidA (YjgF/YER057c/UK114 family)
MPRAGDRDRYLVPDHEHSGGHTKSCATGRISHVRYRFATVYVTDLNDVPSMNDEYKKIMPDPKPARATVQVAGIIGGAKIEISAIAVKH